MRSLITILIPVMLRAAPVVAAQQSDSVAVVQAVSRFHEALAAGDSATALSLLAPDFVVSESGEVESLADYRAHHLPADIEFARSVAATRTVRSVRVNGATAWVTSESRSEGSFRARPIRSAGAELMVLARDAQGWRIRAVHWSSHAIRSKD